MRADLEVALLAATTLPPGELPRFLGELEEIRCTALSRLAVPAAIERPDELLTVKQAAKRLELSEGFLYRNHARLPFTRRMGRSLRFSSLGIDEYIRRTGALTPKRRSVI
jgi:excisionase family DNA binding protein